ncbi:DUF2378 family protein [Pyxidicoccus parkwayensis]|uniref:DUF2378 family protein n=1 Tax=Pyxidicoccus parkwayensis TaxID=2813578 RepID=A0ABX7NQN8_9BACT|nr:DUF2378 family protein [Pyxidicoccus parkwaysis]QSQ21177.1 DUF2378 family protein [Pyxidicoccus parkwaysis]
METVTAQPVGREPVVFGHALEALLAAAEPLTPTLHAGLERLGLSARRPLHAAYPYPVWPEAIRLLAGTEDSQFALGQRYLERIRQSKVGAALHDFAKAVGAERMLLRMSRNIRSTNNVLDAVVTPRSEDAGWELLVRPLAEFAHTPDLRAEPPHFVRGLLTTAFQNFGSVNARVELIRHDAARASSTFHVML